MNSDQIKKGEKLISENNGNVFSGEFFRIVGIDFKIFISTFKDHPFSMVRGCIFSNS